MQWHVIGEVMWLWKGICHHVVQCFGQIKWLQPPFPNRLWTLQVITWGLMYAKRNYLKKMLRDFIYLPFCRWECSLQPVVSCGFSYSNGVVIQAKYDKFICLSL